MDEILIVDDERTVREGLKDVLGGEGFGVRVARDGDEALRKIAEKRPDLVLLDVMMPKKNGFRVCEEIRKADGLLPVIFLTAKDSENDQIRALGVGADDFVSKTASESLLLARIERVMERLRKMRENATAAAEERVFRIGSLTVDTITLDVRSGDRELPRLTCTEINLLKILSRRRGEVITISGLIDELRGTGFACEDAVLYKHISNLRKKIASSGVRLVSVHSIGYKLEV